MAIQLVDVGTYKNDGTGDPLRTAFEKINNNFEQFSPIAFSGEYSSLYGTPALADVASTGQYSSLLGAPSLGALSSLSTINNNNWFGTPLSIQNGGTGQVFPENAFNALSPISAPGDLIYGDTQSKAARLSIGSNNSVLVVINNAPAWSTTISPGGYNGQMQYNNNGVFGAASALTYQPLGTFLTVTSLNAGGVPLNIVGAPGQYGDLLDFTADSATQGNLGKFTSNGTLYIQNLFVQGAPLAATSLELTNTHFYGQYFQLKANTGAYAPYMKTVDGNETRFYQANGHPVWSIAWGDDCHLHRSSPGCFHHHNYMNSCMHRCDNWWQDDNNWEGCIIDWQTESNICRFGTDHSNGEVRELHLITGGKVACIIDVNQNFITAQQELGTTASDGYVHLPSCSGTPTGSPTFFTGTVPIVINQVNNSINFSINGSWYHVVLSPGAY